MNSIYCMGYWNGTGKFIGWVIACINVDYGDNRYFKPDRISVFQSLEGTGLCSLVEYVSDTYPTKAENGLIRLVEGLRYCRCGSEAVLNNIP